MRVFCGRPLDVFCSTTTVESRSRGDGKRERRNDKKKVGTCSLKSGEWGEQMDEG
jgi:hypothetical protein